MALFLLLLKMRSVYLHQLNCEEMLKVLRNNKVNVFAAILIFAAIMMVVSSCSIQSNCGKSKRGMNKAHKKWN